MLDRAKEMLDQAGYKPYYLYRQKQMTGNFENVGYAKGDTAGIYNIRIMEEAQTIVALGAGGSARSITPETTGWSGSQTYQITRSTSSGWTKCCREKKKIYLRDTDLKLTGAQYVNERAKRNKGHPSQSGLQVALRGECIPGSVQQIRI